MPLLSQTPNSFAQEFQWETRASERSTGEKTKGTHPAAPSAQGCSLQKVPDGPHVPVKSLRTGCGDTRRPTVCKVCVNGKNKACAEEAHDFAEHGLLRSLAQKLEMEMGLQDFGRYVGQTRPQDGTTWRVRMQPLQGLCAEP